MHCGFILRGHYYSLWLTFARSFSWSGSTTFTDHSLKRELHFRIHPRNHQHTIVSITITLHSRWFVNTIWRWVHRRREAEQIDKSKFLGLVKPSVVRVLYILRNPEVHCRNYKRFSAVPCPEPDQSIITPSSPMSILYYSLYLSLPTWLFPSLSYQNLYALPLLSYLLFTRLHRIPYFYHSKHICRRLQIIKLLVLQFSISSYYFILLLS
jgi:hypothetical protein